MIEGIRRLRKYVCLHTHENVSGPSNDFDNSARPLDVLTIADAIEREVEERYIELPKDADDVPIRPGDNLKFDDGETITVYALTSNMVFYCREPDRDIVWRGTEHAHHHSVESVLEEFANKRVRLFFEGPLRTDDGSIKEFIDENNRKNEELIAEYAAKLQLKEAE